MAPSSRVSLAFPTIVSLVCACPPLADVDSTTLGSTSQPGSGGSSGPGTSESSPSGSGGTTDTYPNTGDNIMGGDSTSSASSGDTSTGDTSTGDTGTGDTGTGDTSTGGTATDETSTGDTSTGDTGGPSMCQQNFEWPGIDFCYSEPTAHGEVPGTGVLLAGDVDQDGHVDVIVPGAAGGIAVWRGDGAGGLAGPVLTPVDAPHSAATGDFDADGRLDLVVSFVGPPARIDLLLGDGAGGFVVETSFASGPTVGSDLATGDFDGDGDLDAVAIHNGLGSKQKQRLSSISSHDGQTWTYADQLLTMLIDDVLYDVWTPRLATGNFDGVHTDVIVTTVRSVESPRRLRSDGLGTFTYEGPLAPGALVGTNPVVALDVDGDGDNDVLGTRSSGSMIRYLENLGGAWGPAVDTMLPGYGLMTLAVGELVHTPRPDLVLMNGNGSVTVRTIEADGEVPSPSPAAFYLQSARGYTLADLNEDGFSDFVYLPFNPPHALSVQLSE